MITSLLSFELEGVGRPNSTRNKYNGFIQFRIYYCSYSDLIPDRSIKSNLNLATVRARFSSLYVFTTKGVVGFDLFKISFKPLIFIVLI